MVYLYCLERLRTKKMQSNTDGVRSLSNESATPTGTTPDRTSPLATPKRTAALPLGHYHHVTIPLYGVTIQCTDHSSPIMLVLLRSIELACSLVHAAPKRHAIYPLPAGLVQV